MDNDTKAILFEVIAAILSLLIFIGIIVYIIFFENKKDNIDSNIEECTIVAKTISEEPQTANLRTLLAEPIIEQESPQYAINIIESFVIIEEEVIIEEIELNEVNPYTELIDSLTEYEKELIYKITFAESGNQEAEGQRAVVEVILNRVLSNNFPDTVEGVLSQPHQFSTWSKRNKIKQEDQNKIVEILELVYAEEPILPSVEYVFFDGKKHTKYATNYIKIQDHWFGTKY